ncbi:hypothetical protein, partial [Sedimentimonas flavescens]|uniref:hypothetical protein n=1 Tax=Sedimentimonas flavescens TaxID=2851012 RepID=UPI001C4A62E0
NTIGPDGPVRHGPRQLWGKRARHGALSHQLAWFCSAAMADFCAAVDIVWLEEQLATEEDPRLRQIFEEDAVRSRNLIDIIDTALSPVPKPGSPRLLGRNG